MSKCEFEESHSFKFLRTCKKHTYGNYNTHFVRIDYFYCEHCLKEQEIKKEETCRDTPMWYIGD